MRDSAPFASLPGPAPFPLLGWRGNLVRFFRDPIGYMAPLPRAFGAVVPFVRGGVGGPVLIREAQHGPLFAFGAACAQAVWGQMGVFHSTRVPGPEESPSFSRITAGLFNMNDEQHRQQRRLIQPAFHRARLEEYAATMATFAERAIEGWRAGDTRDVAREMTHLTLAVANRTLFGLEMTPGEQSLGERIQEVVELSMNPASMVPLRLPFTPRQRLVDGAARTEAALRAMIARRRAAGQGGDVITTLLATRDEDGDALGEDELIGQLFILFFAGHDTTRTAVAWTLFLLSQHPAVLADLHDELRGALRGAAPAPADLPRLPLLDRVLKESLRLLPPAPFTARITTAATELGGVHVPARTEVVLSPYCLHREPDLYPEPQRFRPERWEKLAPSPFEYAPFGAGPRMCIGAGFATMELKIVLALLLQRFSFELSPGAQVDRRTTIVMSPRHGMPMVLRPPGTPPPRAQVRGDVREMVDLP